MLVVFEKLGKSSKAPRVFARVHANVTRESETKRNRATYPEKAGNAHMMEGKTERGGERFTKGREGRKGQAETGKAR